MIIEKYEYTKLWNFDLGYDFIYPIYIKNRKYEEFNNVYLDGEYIDVYELDNETKPILPENTVGVKIRKIIIMNWRRELESNLWYVTKNEYYLKVFMRMITNIEYEIKKEINIYNYTDPTNQTYQVTEIKHKINKKKYNKFGELIENTQNIINNEEININLDIGDSIYITVFGDYNKNLNSGYIKNEKEITVWGGKNSTQLNIYSYGIFYYYTMEYIKRELIRKEKVDGFKPGTFPINVNV